jgi:hypothetical protein
MAFLRILPSTGRIARRNLATARHAALPHGGLQGAYRYGNVCEPRAAFVGGLVLDGRTFGARNVLERQRHGAGCMRQIRETEADVIRQKCRPKTKLGAMKVPLRIGVLLVAIVVPCVAMPSDAEPRMTFRVVVPDEFRNSKFAPNGDPEPVRYTKAYEAFWWNCVMVKGEDLNARCPFVCSGTPAATSGCAEGANNAGEQIGALLKQFSAQRVQAYLKQLGSKPDARQRLSGYGYFQDGPKAEDVPH